MQKEAQVSVEAMVSISIMIIIFLFALGFTFSKRGELLNTEKYLEKRKECSSVANAITQTKLLGDGAETRLTAISNVSIYNKSDKSENNKSDKFRVRYKNRFHNFNISSINTLSYVSNPIEEFSNFKFV